MRGHHGLEMLRASKCLNPALHQAVAKLIAVNQLPLSFTASEGFQQFMAVIEPGYKIIKEDALKRRLNLLADKLTDKIREKLLKAKSIACTADLWSSRTQESYLTCTTNIIDDEWNCETMTLSTQEMEERHTAVNIAKEINEISDKWGISSSLSAVVTDNATNIVNAVSSSNVLEKNNLTCAAHSIQLAVNKSFLMENVANVCSKASKIVGHFRHSNVAAKELETMQEQLEMKQLNLIQSCKTRWNSTYEMLDRLLVNRIPVMNVLNDRTKTLPSTAQRLEMFEAEWFLIDELVKILKPLQVATNLLCSDAHSPVSMVRPLLQAIIKNHLNDDDTDSETAKGVKLIIKTELEERFKLIWNQDCEVNARQIASLLDPRYKDLCDEHIDARQLIRNKVMAKLQNSVPIEDREQSTEADENSNKSALEYIYKTKSYSNMHPLEQFNTYLAEPQIRFDMDPFQWWKLRAVRYPAVADIAKNYLCIPATSASSERTFSTAGNIVTAKRSCLLPKNVSLLVFLYQNKKMLD
ncbi:E3 SUMO-protein ligase ZBED1-like [Cydia pomonella]|uniref:E3 SUMO-protein ligase ZBED1-like n=1 Tax=Cydia pomonella TaxID=82600 RepID=UPI002ADDA9E5|nr:E3 SUMO-protein ligase ZBED1-like [Cydia pomonella]